MIQGVIHMDKNVYIGLNLQIKNINKTKGTFMN